MMQIYKFQYLEDLDYDRKPVWTREKGKMIVQGLFDLGQAVAAEIIFVGLPKMGLEVQQGKTFTSLESEKWVGRIPAMASGKVFSLNFELETNPELVSESPFEEGWLVEIEMSDSGELDNLMRAHSPEFQSYIQEEMRKHSQLLG